MRPILKAISSKVLLSTAFCPPVEYFALLAKSPVVQLEAMESYQKQSYRNRCRIMSANGPLDLSFPVVHSPSRLISSVEVDYSVPWVAKMEKALESAYESSPFFEFYRDALFGILESEPARLWDLNLQIITWLCEKIGLQVQLLETTDWVQDAAEDYREAIHPKRPDSILDSLGLLKPYWQVFRDRYGFVPGLSVLDLLFCEGPDSILWLR